MHVVDLFSTVLELAGVNAAEVLPHGVTLDSVSLVPYLVDPARPSIRTTVPVAVSLVVFAWQFPHWLRGQRPG